MERLEYELSKEIQFDHWHFFGRKKIIQTIVDYFIKPTHSLSIADVGCGYGCNIPVLSKYGFVTALEPYEDARKYVQEKWGPQVEVVQWESPSPHKKRFDLIVLSDVLEHIADDKVAADWIYDHLNLNGHCIITVPAHQFLWTQMDDAVHHYRRYDETSLRALFENKFRISYFTYYNFFLFPVKLAFVLFDRIIQTLFPRSAKRSFNEVLPCGINRFFKFALLIETVCMRFRIRFPYGASIVMVAGKEVS